MKLGALRGAVYGCSAWMVYGALETVLSIGSQLRGHPQVTVMGWQWSLILLLMGVYAAAGSILGGVIGSVLGWSGREPGPYDFQRAASFTLVLAFGANLISRRPLAGPEYIALAVAGVLVTIFAAALFADRGRKRILFLAGPWPTCLLLMGAPWIIQESPFARHSALYRTAVAALILALVVFAAAFARRFRNSPLPSPLRQAASACAIFGMFFVSVLLRSATASIPSPAAALPDSSKPNVLLITMDTVRADHLPMYGYRRDTAPNLRELSQSATLYTRAIAVSDYTLPTHASIFTGLYPPWHGALILPPPDNRQQRLRPETATLAQILRANGYWTAESVANSGFLGPWTGLTKGFMVSEWEPPVDLSVEVHPFYLREQARRFLGRQAARLDQASHTAADVGQRAAALLDRAKLNQRPFFVFLNYMDAHWPYDSEAALPQQIDRRARTTLSLRIDVNEGTASLSPGQRDFLISEYDAGIAAEDASIAAVLNRLRALGLYDNTLVAITADHGEGFLEHGFLDHIAGMTYQENLHVPLLIKYPKQREGRLSDLLVSQVDLAPTILDAAGIAAARGLQGRSLRHAQPSGSDTVFAVARPAVPDAKNRKIQGAREAAISGSLKLVLWTTGQSELYDLSSDPEEKHNLYAPDDPRVIDLSRRVTQWIATAPPLKHGTKMGSSDIQRLKSLGYIQ